MKEVFSSNPSWINFARMIPAGMASLCLAAALLLPLAQAQDQGIVEGRIVNGTTSRTPSKVAVDVISPAGGMTVLKSSVTDGAGNFHFDRLPVDAPLLIRADYGGVSYYSPLRFDASGKASLEIQVFEPTTSMKGIRLESLRIAFKLTGEGIRSLESYTFNNETRPPQSIMREDGIFRFSKAPGITEPPRLDVKGPGAIMPVTQPPLESADGRSYYSLYPLRPGSTTFEVAELLPYQNRSYVFRKKFYEDVNSLEIGVIPPDMAVSGEGVVKVQTGEAQNFAVYSSGPFKAGTEVAWTFSGGTPVVETPTSAPAPADEPRVRPMPTLIGQNALIIGPLLLIGFMAILWYAHNHLIVASAKGRDTRIQELKERRDQLLNYVAALDDRYERQDLDRREYLRLREQGKRHLRRIAMLLTKK